MIQEKGREVAVHESHLLDMFSNPFRTAQGFIEYCLAWLFTRPWRTVIGFLPVLLLLSALGGLAIYGWSIDDRKLVSRYAQWSDAELNSATSPANAEAPKTPEAAALMKVESVSPFAELLLRRILQLEKSDSRSRYLVALQIGNRGRRGQARQIMRQLAPGESNGFAPAHAWLAIDRLLQGPIADAASRAALMHDLELAATWSGTGAQLRVLLAELLEKEGRVGEAIKALQSAAEVDSSSWIPLVAVSLRNGRKQPAQEASAKAKSIFTERINQHKASASDYINLARLWILESQHDEAIKQVGLGLRQFPDDRSLRLVLSECYRVKFLSTYRETPTGIEFNLALLDEALKADPTNPAVSEEVAKLLARGGNASQTLIKALEEQLAEGKATTMTHLMLATRSLKEEDFQAAVPHLEVALRNAPNAPIVLNNLALALVRVSTANAPRSRELIDRALRISGPNAEVLDSQGEIRMIAKDYVGAVESFESAIGLDGNRISSRKRLIEAYDGAGLKDMIPVQAAKVRELEKSLKP